VTSALARNTGGIEGHISIHVNGRTYVVLNRPDSPVGGRDWPVLVPKIDADGNDLPGIRMPDVAAPMGAYLVPATHLEKNFLLT
jgi:hypothetical protein